LAPAGTRLAIAALEVADVTIEEQQIEVDGLLTHYLAAGEGPPLLLLHALGESALDWRWVLPDLARTHRVYAPDLPGFGDSAKPTADYSPVFFEGFVAAFLDALEVERAAVVDNSLGGLTALRLALSEPARTSALALIDSAGLGREVSSALKSPTLPGYGEMLVTLSKTPLGATQRTWLRLPLLFDHPERVPPEWFEEQYRLAQLPGFSEAVVSALRAQVDPGGQREVGGSTPQPGDSNARRLGRVRPYIPRLSSTRSDRQPSKGLSRAHPGLRSPAPLRTTRPLRCRPQALPRVKSAQRSAIGHQLVGKTLAVARTTPVVDRRGVDKGHKVPVLARQKLTAER
jgi:2-hydroxy-6-oxonona-2,4-dienedioate hydrolase